MEEHKEEVLDQFYEQIRSIILTRQHPVTGLLPASTAISIHGDYTDAWVRDNVYSIMAVWALSLAYKNTGSNSARQFELEHSTINLMRGLMRAMMRQSHKVEAFKSSLALHDALHAKYDTETGLTVVGDHEWGHLQIDATSLYLLMLAQMISSGLPIITSQHEIDFIQNLIYYIERAYRTPDYGIWERGEKTNIGYVELNASSIGMAKAALEALSGFDLYGKHNQDNARRIQVIPDNLAQASITLSALLPRESNTKEIDAALLSITGYPAFAVREHGLRSRVKDKIRKKLGGKYGYKRFLRDGHQTVLEDEHRHYYNPEELKKFEDIESEWPLFYTYEYLDAIFRGDQKEAASFKSKIESVLVKKDGKRLLPELYFVPLESVAAEKKNPGSQKRTPNNNVPLVWAQSLYLMASLLESGHISTQDIDPIGLHARPDTRDPEIHLLLVAENRLTKEKLDKVGIQSETIESLNPYHLIMPEDMAYVFNYLGHNDTLKLSGRDRRRIKTLATSRLYHVNEHPFICLSLFFLQREFYLAYDIPFLISRFKSELTFIHRHWNQEGNPLVAIWITEDMITSNQGVLVDLLQDVSRGSLENISIRTGSFEILKEGAAIERINIGHHFDQKQFVGLEGFKTPDKLEYEVEHRPITNEEALTIEVIQDPSILEQMLKKTRNLYRQIEIISNIAYISGLHHEITIEKEPVTVKEIINEIYEAAGKRKLWSVVRQAAGLLGKIDINLQASVSTLLLQQKIIQVGKAFSDHSLIIRPLPFGELMEKINEFCRDDMRDRVLTQEILVYLSNLMKSNPELFKDIITIRVSYIILLITGYIAREQNLHQEDANDALMHMAPSELELRVKTVLEQYSDIGQVLKKLESIHVVDDGEGLKWVNNLGLETLETPDEGWMTWRQSTGTLSRLGKQFYKLVWELLEHTDAIIIGDKLDPRNRLESKVVLSDMTSGEKAFELRIEHLLNKIIAPEYRQLTMEALIVLSHFTEQNPDLYIDDHVSFDVINGHAVRIAFLDYHPELEANYQDHKAEAWTFFYGLPPAETSTYTARALQYLMAEEPQPST